MRFIDKEIFRHQVVRRLLVPAATMSLAGAGYYAWRSIFGEDHAGASLITAVVQRGDLEDTVTATGTLQPRDFVDVGTQVSGQMKKLLRNVGDIVTVGR